MFHQVFICNTPQDPDDSRDPILDQNSLENAPQILKQENTTSGSTAMGYVQTEDLKMAVGELKSEQYTAIDNQIFTKTDIKASEMGHDTKDLLKVTPYSNTTSPPKMIIQQSQQTSVIPPLGPTYSSTPSLEDMVLQPQPTLVNMNENLVQLSAPPVAVIVPATPVIDAGLSQSPTMKIEPSFSLSNVGMSEELKSEKIVTSSSQFKIEGEEPMEDIDLPDHADSGDTEIHHGAVNIQEFNETNKSVLRHIIRQSGTEKKEKISLTTDNTEPVSKVPLIESNPKLQKCCGNESTTISDSELKSTYLKKEFVVINRSNSQYLTPETIQGSYLENEVEPILKEYQYSSASDREESHTDDDSSGSDWEEEYLGKLRKTQNILEMGISNSTENAVQNMNVTNQFQNSKKFVNNQVQTVTFTNVQPIDACKSDKEVIELKLKNNQRLPVKAQNSRDSTKRLPLENPILKSLLDGKTAVTGPNIVGEMDSLSFSTSPSHPIPDDNHVSNAKSKTNKSKKNTFQLKLPFKLKVNNMKLHFTPQNKILSSTGIKNNKLNKNIQDQTVTEFHPINPHKKWCKKSAEIGIKQKTHVTSPPTAQNNKDNAQRTIFRKVLPDSRVAPSGSQPACVVDVPSPTTPTSQNVHHGAVKFQEFNGTKNSILRPNIRQSGGEKMEEMCSRTEITDFVSKVQFKQINLISQKHCGNKGTKISDDKLRIKHNIKECIVVINRSISKYLTPETIPDNNLVNKVEPVLKDYQYSSASDREENHTDVDVSSDSDWEEEYLNKLRNTKKWLGNRIGNKTVNSVQSMNLTNHSTQQTNESCSEGLECSFEEENKISSPKKLSTPTSSGTISESDIYGPSLFTTPQNNNLKAKNHLSSQNYTKKDLLRCKMTYNTGSIKVNSEGHTFPPEISVKTTIENVRSLQFIPINKTVSNTDLKHNSNDNTQSQTVNFTNIQPIDAYKSNKEIIEFNQKNNKILPHVAQVSRNYTERLTLENSILKPKTAVTGPDIVGAADTLSLSTPFSIPDDNRVSNAKSNKNEPPTNIFQLKLPLKKKINNMTFHFMPQNKIASTTETQIGPNKNNPAQTVTCTKFQPFNAHKKVEKTLAQAELKQKNGIISPHIVRNHKKHVKKTFRKILPKPRISPSSSQPVGVLDMPLYISPPSQDDCHNGDSDEDLSSKIDQRLSEVSHHTYHCNKCDKYFEIVDQYLSHKKYSLCGGHRREAKHQCDICGKCFNGREKMEAHKNTHTNTRPFKCFDCDKSFNSKNTRYIHHQKMHLNKKTRFLCCFCGYICPSSEHLLAHEEEHRLPEGSEAAKPFKCLVCGKGFISRFKQQKHKREHQLKKCSKCSEQFKTYTQLRNHMEVEHSIIKTYDCKECGMQFKNADTLRSHHTAHSSVLLYSCDICDKGFKRKGNLRQHMITHSDERPISCSECGESFKRITHLKQHTAAFHGDGRK